MSEYVLFEQKGHVAIVTINRPERMNALGHEVRTGFGRGVSQDSPPSLPSRSRSLPAPATRRSLRAPI